MGQMPTCRNVWSYGLISIMQAATIFCQVRPLLWALENVSYCRHTFNFVGYCYRLPRTLNHTRALMVLSPTDAQLYTD